MSRRVFRIQFDLPNLTPAQADLLWNLFDRLAERLWEAYETEILDSDSQLFGSASHEPSDEDVGESPVTPSAPPGAALNDAPDTDF